MTVQIKYCGCQSEEDYKLLIESKADLIGFIFAESKREVDPTKVNSWIQKYGKPKKLVGVFQNASLQRINDVISTVPIDIIQCHGTETVDQLKEIRDHSNKEIYKALPYSEHILKEIELYGKVADSLIVDSVAKGQFGGTGIPFSWKEVPNMMRKANALGVTCFIAGGIRPDNVSELIRHNPHGIDLSGGIEENGKKSLKRIETLERMIMR
ncbi:phosphoribosylanthranilate isomerase [Fictibacillus halophilus]|uniref:N-(5'-phosphoribosyl)anthranilate isomerase n=1 Tax=Fictibacillus halophilus TaxID=1610490 RepID=A0ABV2LKI4_9BACL|nr:phosphoribosylanthranilate isomerase [Fictibacillus halophilus]